ncbi:MAG: DNA topoisomerase IV subunit A [Betaproteobacteria bacterium]|nr:DNA topoisomerase IV subunit A [Betaproteobacteria bacterium]MDH5219618.1 DNA topoisomerase IV subunit A [Betaproteobacteria bacterium]MDH5350006.1 DNA topoisomerase IV subunit A [Betaproteobacteria bacterium]
MDTHTPDLFTPENGDDAAPIEQHASQAYLGYAVSTVKARALPEIADGLKPVQRRILYAMGDAGAQGFAKCARYVGEVLGKYHPHGDSSTYEALVHLAQPFSMRYPLIDGQGNFGSRDGDSAAAYRYTEAKLSRYAELMLAEIGEGTVDFQKNYDGKFEEPVLLPARLPFGLLNGSFGIPVGFSTRIPSHNLKEVAAAAALVIKHPRAKLDEILDKLPGPDFPGGGQIISPAEEIRQAYESGRGSIAMRARWSVEPLARGQWRIVVTELPHGVSCRQVLEEIEALANPRPATGKKEVGQEQKRLRQFILDQVEAVRDESDRKSKLRLVIEPRSSRQDPGATMAALLVNTSLESRYPVNLTWLGLDGLPETKGIADILREWGEWRQQTVRRRTEHRLAKCEERLHIVLGRLLAYVRIDEIIKLIRAAEDQAEAKQKMIAKWKFSERQAEDIINIRLGQLTKLDGVKLNDERKALEGERKDLKAILGDDKQLKKLVVKELEEDAKKYGDERRTLIKAEERAQVERTVVEEPITVILSQKGWIRARSGHGLDPATLTFKDGDGPLQSLECRTTDPVIVLAASGKSFTIDAAAIPAGRGDGAPVNTLVNAPSDDIVWMGTGDLQRPLLMNSSAGLGFLCKLGDLVAKTKQGKDFMSVAQGAHAQVPAPVTAGKYVAALSSDARLLLFPLDEVPVRPNGGVGVQLLALPDNVTLASVAVTDGRTLVVSGVKRKNRATETLDAKLLAGHIGKRAQRGRVCDAGFRPDRVGS